MLINEIGVKDENEVVELDRYREASDPKSRESMTTILSGALAAEAAPVEHVDAPVVELSAPAPAPAQAPAGDVGNAA